MIIFLWVLVTIIFIISTYNYEKDCNAYVDKIKSMQIEIDNLEIIARDLRQEMTVVNEYMNKSY